MKLIAKILRKITDFEFALLGLAVIEDIPTENFNIILKEYLAAGWVKVYEYEGFDAWIDYGRIDLKKGRSKIRLEWDNWTEGQIRGPRTEIEALAKNKGLSSSTKIKWAPLE